MKNAAPWFASPIKGKYHAIRGYAVARGYGKDREEVMTFMVAADRTVEAAYENATDLATLLNISPIN